MDGSLAEIYNQAIDVIGRTGDNTEPIPLSDLLKRVKLAHSALTQARVAQETSPAPTVEVADRKLWERTLSKLRPSQAKSAELGQWYGQLMMQIVKVVSTEISTVNRLSMPPDEKMDLMPVPRHEGVNDDELIDLDSQGVEESDASFTKLVYSQLDAAKGKIWACGGVRGAIIAAGAVDVNGLYFQTEYSLYILKTGKVPAGQALATCQKRAEARMAMVQPLIEDGQTLAGLQFVLNEKGNLDWVPLTRSK